MACFHFGIADHLETTNPPKQPNQTNPTVPQDAALRVLRTACTSSASKLAAATAAVGRLGHYDLAAGVAGLEDDVRSQGATAAAPSATAGAPAALHSLLASLQRARHLLVGGAKEMAAEPQVAKSVQVGAGRPAPQCLGAGCAVMLCAMPD